MTRKGQWNRALPMVFAIGMAGTGLARAQVVVGGMPDVEVDTSVLDQLGPAPTLPGLFLHEAPASSADKITLIRPKSVRGKSMRVKKVGVTSADSKSSTGPCGRARKKRHHLTVLPLAAEGEPGVIHLHPIHRAARHHHAVKPKQVKEAALAVAREPEPAPAPVAAPAPTVAPVPPPPAPAPTPVLTPATNPPPSPGPMSLSPPTAPAAAPVPAPAPTPAPVAMPPSAAPAGPGPLALTAQQPNTPESVPAIGAQETFTTLTFDKDSARLPEGARDSLAHLASRMLEDATLEVQLLAYADGNEESASKARRLSLSRALAVRSFLIDQGVRSTRIEVRALGNKVPDGSPDRVDIIGQKRG